MIKFNFSFKTMILALVGVVCLGVTNAQAGVVRSVSNADELSSALSAFGSGDTIRLVNESEYSCATAFSYSRSYTCVLDLNGKKFKSSAEKLMTLNSSTTFIVTDTKGGGAITCARSTDKAANCFYITNGTLRIEGGTVSATNTAGPAYAVYVERLASGDPRVEVKGNANIYANSSTSNANGLYVWRGGKIDISGNPTLEAIGSGTNAGRALRLDNNGVRSDSTYVNISGGTFKASHILISESYTWIQLIITGGAFYTTSKLITIPDGGGTKTKIKGGYFTATGFSNQLKDSIPTGYSRVDMSATSPYKDDDIMYQSKGYRYIVVPTGGCEAKVQNSSETYWHYFNSFTQAFDYAKTESLDPTIKLLRGCSPTAAFTFDPKYAITATLDLNNCQITPQNTVDRFMDLGKPGVTLVVTDSSVGKGGAIICSRASSGACYGINQSNGTLRVEGGKISATASSGDAYAVYAQRGAGGNSNRCHITVKNDAYLYAKGTGNVSALRTLRVGTINISGNPVLEAMTGSAGRALRVENDGEYTDDLGNKDSTYISITGGTFKASQIALQGSSITHLSILVSGGIFYSSVANVVNMAAGVPNLKFKGGYFYDTSGTGGASSVTADRIATGYQKVTMSPSEISSNPALSALSSTGWRKVIPYTYTITYKDQGGSAFSGTHASGYPTTHTYGTATTLKTASKTGYTFGGWYTSSDCSGSAVTTLGATAYTADITLYAKWTINTYTIRFLNYDGSVLQSGSVNYGVTPTYSGSTPSKPTDAQYTYAFSGWSPAITSVTGNQDYTAQFNPTARTYSVTLHTNEGSINAGNVTSYTYGTGATLPTNVTKTGYTFAGWYANSSLTGSAVTNISTTATGNKEYWAKWTPNANTAYTVKHYKQLLDGSYSATPDATDNLTANVTPAVKSYTGFDAPSTQTVSILADGSRVVEYKYTRKSYTLTWNANGGVISGTGHTSGSVKYDAPIIVPANANVTRDGHDFTGWNTTPASTMPAYDVEYTAQWSVHTHKLAWDFDGGTPSGSYTPAGNAVAYGTLITYPTVEKTGYTFAGWSTDATSMPDADLTITASWTPNANTAYTVKHYKQLLDGSYSATPDATDNLTRPSRFDRHNRLKHRCCSQVLHGL